MDEYIFDFLDLVIANGRDMVRGGEGSMRIHIAQDGSVSINYYPISVTDRADDEPDDDEPDCDNCTDTDCIHHPDFDPCCCDDTEDENAKDDGIEVIVHKIESTEEAIEKLKEIFGVS